MEDGGCVGLDLGEREREACQLYEKRRVENLGYIRCEATSGGVGNEVRVMTLSVEGGDMETASCYHGLFRFVALPVFIFRSRSPPSVIQCSRLL